MWTNYVWARTPVTRRMIVGRTGGGPDMELRTQTQEIEAEVFLFSHRIGGKIVCPQNQRLADFLQSGGEVLERCEALNLLKAAICFIAPNESSEQVANRRAVRFGIATPATSRLPV